MSARGVDSTYRLQLRPDLGFSDVAALAPYLARLGVTHVYLSPYLRAAPGSTHGYDVVDHTGPSEELGGSEAFERMCSALGDHGLGVVVDIVPNHMHIASERNVAWWDVLRRGRSSPYSRWFDIDWDARDGKLLLGVLGDELDSVLAAGELERDTSNGEPTIRYFERHFPLAPGTEELSDLRALLDAQHYELADWRYADRNLNYRRFFEIDDLAALRIEEAEVFEATHRRYFEDVGAGRIQGLRVDHIDGLRDPRGYLERLRAAIGDDVYLVVEKILEVGESIPDEWPIQGSTGYDMLNLITGVLVDGTARDHFDSLYRDLLSEQIDARSIAITKKLLVQRFLMAADLARLASGLAELFESLGWDGDVDVLRVAISQVTAGLPIYRTYVEPRGDITERDRAIIEQTVSDASRRAHLDPAVFRHLRSILLLEAGGAAGLEWVLRFQQYTGPVMAKGIEDTFFYGYNRFIALNEVGGDPLRFGVSPRTLHEAASDRAARSSRSMVATSTHDTKRSEDVRARLALLSELPEAWSEAVATWFGLAEPHRVGSFPDANTGYLLFQTLVGAWPLDATRATEFMIKATREAKRHTSWHDPDVDKEAALRKYIHGVLGDAEIVSAIEHFVRPLVRPGWANALAQTLLKLTLPGVPDIYQGCEVWDLSLVDPDNRRAVDFGMRSGLLARIGDVPARELWAEPDDGAPKLLLIQRALALRASLPEAFAGGYEPLATSGREAERAIAFTRGGSVAVLAPRLPLSRPGGWGETSVELPSGAWRDVITGTTLPGGATQVASLLEDFPVALLARLEP